MGKSLNSKINKELSSLEKRKDDLLILGKNVLEAYNSNFYPFDLVVIGAINRSLGNISAFAQLIRNENFITAAPIIRMELDTLIRLYAFWLVEEPHDLASKVLKGDQINKIKDKEGNCLTDKYLCLKLEKDFQIDWVYRVYQKTSGYIHLSTTHLHLPFVPSSIDKISRTFSIEIGPKNPNVPNKIILEGIDCFGAIVQLSMKLIEGWKVTKQNPELVEKLKKEIFPD